MLKIKENKGMSLIMLIISILIILIIASILITKGINLIKKAKIDNFMANMITIRAKAKVYSEKINVEILEEKDKNNLRKELYLERYHMTFIEDDEEIISKIEQQNIEDKVECYAITKQTLEDMGLGELEEQTNDGDYIIIYNLEDYNNVEVVYRQGVIYNKNTYYTLSSIQEAVE